MIENNFCTHWDLQLCIKVFLEVYTPANLIFTISTALLGVKIARICFPDACFGTWVHDVDDLINFL